MLGHARIYSESVVGAWVSNGELLARNSPFSDNLDILIILLSMYSLTTICEIDDFNVEILFHVLSDYEMTSDVLIGSKLLRKTGLSVIETQNSAKLCSQLRVMHM